jgi:5-dehydro-2-deoxygluconokinase
MDYRPSSWGSPEAAGRMAQSILPWVDVVLGNEEELAILTGVADARTQVQAILTAGPKVVVRKLGQNGVEAYTASGSCSAPAWPTQVICAVGGGDGFAAGFLYGFYRGEPLSECLKYGNAAAAIVVGRIACAASMPTLEELHEKIHSATTSAAALGGLSV